MLLFQYDFSKAQVINYTFGTVAAVYAYNATPTVFPELPQGIDDAITNPKPIGFNFDYGCTTYSQFIASSNGWMTFNMGCIGSDPNNQLAGNATQITNAERPIIAALWDDLDIGAGGNVNYLLTGVSPNRILTIEWKKMLWKVTALAPCISFQVKLYETSNRIDFVYLQEAGALSIPTNASAGLTGAANGNYYSLQNYTNVMSVTNNTGENTNLNAKPASSQSYSWMPVCVLPIELIYFAGENNNGKNNFEWATATEKNNDHFTLEGSSDGINFTELQKINGAGNSNSIKHYQTNRDPDNLIYFRLKQTDYDKNVSYSKTIAIEESKRKEIKFIYPNPSAANFNLYADEPTSVKVYSYTGQLIEELNANEYKIIVFGENYAAGIYFVKMEYIDGIKTLKLIKN
jgi:hypothetical protein